MDRTTPTGAGGAHPATLPEPAVLDLAAGGPADLRVLAGYRRTAGLARMLDGTRWWLHPDGRLLVVPAPGLARDDLFPLPGRHRPDPDGIRIHASHRHPDGPTARITGLIRGGHDGRGPWELDARYTVTAAGGSADVAVRQPLVPAAGRPTGHGGRTGRPPLPSVYRVTLTGRAADVRFGPMEGELTVLPPAAGAPWPLEVLLATDDGVSPGSLLWLASAYGLSRDDNGGLTMTLDDDGLRCAISAPDGTLGVSWGARLPVPATAADLRLSWTDGRVEGGIHAAAVLFGERITYSARLEGAQAVHDAPGPGDFERCWQARTLADPVSPAGLSEPSGLAGPSDPSDASSLPDPSGTSAAVPGAGAGWRELRDRGFDLTLSGEHRRAVPALRRALTGCRAERALATAPFTVESLLVDEVNILTRLLHCHRFGEDLALVLETLRAAVDTRRELARSEHLALVGREQSHLVMTALSDVLEDWRERLDTDLARVDLLTHAQDFFVSLTDSLAELGMDRTALVAAERGRGRAFLDMRAGRSADGGDPAGTVEALDVRELLTTVREHGAAVLEYSVGEDASRAWLVTPDGELDSVRLPAGARTLEPLITETRALLEHPAPPPERLAEVLTCLHTLLVDPLPAAWLAEHPGEDPPPLTVVPHRTLFRLPFAALREPGTGRYLFERRALTYAPSIGTLRRPPQPRWPRRPGTAPPRLACFVDPHPMPGTLTPLPALRAHLPEVTGQYPPDFRTEYVGPRATLAALRAEAAEADVLLLCTHARADDEYPDRSYIALAPDPAAGHDGLVRPAHLTRLTCRADLVVLMACQSSAGRLTGDGVQGLARAVLLSGATSLLAGQWTVPEELSLALVYEFHEHWLGGGTGKAEALRRAQAGIAAMYPDQPQLWAAFQLAGDWR
ncbi:CHAT domain-containing protein [Streptomyces sp. NPDC026672]|uniref:CHAT domain-containing protein n=1 Tax=unclassified Streptomyces TaxID=2593676 RepID=UPI0033FDE28B